MSVRKVETSQCEVGCNSRTAAGSNEYGSADGRSMNCKNC